MPDDRPTLTPHAAPGPAARPPAAPGPEGTAPDPVRAPEPPRQWDCKPGKVVFQEGEESYDLLILDEGKVDVYVGEEKRASLEGPDVMLGEIGALLRQPRSAKVKAVTPCKFTVYKDFDSLMARDPHKLVEIARSLATKLARSNEVYNKQIMRAFAVLRNHKVKADIIEEIDVALGGHKKKTAPEAKRNFLGLFNF